MSFEASHKSNWKIVNGAKLHYLIAGNGSHPLLLIPGALGLKEDHFQKQLEFFGREGSGFVVVSLDLRGYGQSLKEVRPEVDAFLTDADDCHCLMKSLSFDSYSVIGFCFGGEIGIAMASMYPNSVRHLITISSRSYITKPELNVFDSVRDTTKWPRLIELEAQRELYGRDLQKKWSGFLDNYIDTYTHREGNLCVDLLPNVICPTLIIQGSKDRFTPAFHAEYLHSKIQDSQLFIMQEAKHYLHTLCHEVVNKAINDFLINLPL